MKDWELLGDMLIHPSQVAVFTRMSKLPGCDGFFKGWLQEELSYSYDMGITFIEAHELACKKI